MRSPLEYMYMYLIKYDIIQGRSEDFSKGGGGVTLGQTILSHVAFSPWNIVGCLLKKRLTKAGSRAPQEPPSYALVILLKELCHDILSCFL